MSPDSGFVEQWPPLAQRLNALLARRRVPHHVRADIAQETAIALLERWDDLDKNHDLWPFTATVGLNALRNEARRAARSTASPSIEEDVKITCTTEDAVLARDELRRVGTILGRLTPLQRTAVLTALDEDRGSQPVAVRMTRMRARRRLRIELGRAGFGGAALRWPWTYSWQRLASGVTRHARALETMAQPLIVFAIGGAVAFGSPLPDDSFASVPTQPAATDRVAVVAPVSSDRAYPASRALGRPKPATGEESSPDEQREGLLGGEPGRKRNPTSVITPAGRCSLEGCEVKQRWSRVRFAGQKVRYRMSGSVTLPPCLYDLWSGARPSGCSEPGGAWAEVETEVNGERRRVRVGTQAVN